MIDHSTIEIRHSEFLAPWAEGDRWRKELQREFEQTLAEPKLPERPNYEAANCFLIKAREATAKDVFLTDKF